MAKIEKKVRKATVHIKPAGLRVNHFNLYETY